MAPLVAALALSAIASGACIGVFFKVSFAIRREDRARTLPLAAPSRSAATARALTGVNGSRWD
jgi:hypothetical protein